MFRFLRKCPFTASNRISLFSTCLTESSCQIGISSEYIQYFDFVHQCNISLSKHHYCKWLLYVIAPKLSTLIYYDIYNINTFLLFIMYCCDFYAILRYLPRSFKLVLGSYLIRTSSVKYCVTIKRTGLSHLYHWAIKSFL